MTPGPVAVLGGGPAGLLAAWRLARRGRPVVVLERSEGPGGLAASFEVAGVRVDHGSHRLHPSTDPELLDCLQALLGGTLQRRRRCGRVRLAGRWLGYPLRPGDLARHLPPAVLAGAAADVVLSPLRRRGRPRHFAAAVRAGPGPTLGRHLYFPYARKLWGLEPEELDAEAARRRITAGSPAALARRLLGGDGDRSGGWFFYPRLGFGAISEALAEAAASAGAEIRYRCEVSELVSERAGWRVATADGALLDAGTVLSTLPAPVLARLVRPRPPAAVLEAAGRLRFRGMVLVYLALGTTRYSEFETYYLPGPETPMSRLSEPRGYRDGADPEGTTVLCAELPCTAGDELWTTSDDDLAAMVADDLARLDLPPVRPVETAVRRLPRVYPVYDLGFAPDLAALEAWLGRLPRLLSFGRQGLFAHDNTHHAMATAWAAADALAKDGSVDARGWAAARSRFRDHVVED